MAMQAELKMTPEEGNFVLVWLGHQIGVILVAGIGLLIAYLFDQHYYHGANSAVVVGTFHNVAAGFK
jgi:hypothetical protein